MSYETIHLRDEMLMLADEQEELSLMERIHTALNDAALRRASSLLNKLLDLRDSGDELPPHEYRELLLLIEQAREVLDMEPH